MNHAPWTQDEVDRLNESQQDQTRHPYTCGNQGDGNHGPFNDGVLVATVNGWRCFWCDYKQDFYLGIPPTTKDGNDDD